ncbi:hypothetical protein JTB14_030502 [Gonioctena quinquepunctata]|nr:hypothetical protein JTB14_030502 [Gonioctena quinquepunctata]
MLRSAAATHLLVSLMAESIRLVRNIIPPLTIHKAAVKDDCPRYLLVDENLCWRYGQQGNRRKSCRKSWRIFCSRCGRCGVRSAGCSCCQYIGSLKTKSFRLRKYQVPGFRVEGDSTTPTGSWRACVTGKDVQSISKLSSGHNPVSITLGQGQSAQVDSYYNTTDWENSKLRLTNGYCAPELIGSPDELDKVPKKFEQLLKTFTIALST